MILPELKQMNVYNSFNFMLQGHRRPGLGDGLVHPDQRFPVSIGWQKHRLYSLWILRHLQRYGSAAQSQRRRPAVPTTNYNLSYGDNYAITPLGCARLPGKMCCL